MPRTMRDYRRRQREARSQAYLPGLEPEPPPEPEPEPVDAPPELVITDELRMTVRGWSLPHGWSLLPGESVEGALAAFLAMERRGPKTK